METIELKFLLKLLGCSNYRSSLSASGFKDFKGKDKICRDLCDRGLIDFSREIATVKILSPGSALLKTDKDQSLLTANEQKLLENINKASGKITPSKISVKSVKSEERDAILQRFHERGLIEAETQIKRQKAEVWLTQRGQEYLREEYIPKKGVNPVISLDLLTNYLRFLRKPLQTQMNGFSTQAQTKTPPTSEGTPTSKPSDEEILQLIRNLDRELGTENYLPMFHLRERLQPPLSREQFDQVLYRLQRNDQIELSSLQEAIAYTPEQIDAGIPQDIGGPLFFIAVN
ncbi:MAG TPA: transcription factor RcaD [Cyanobacteria bacterium UBA8543]|nr:transcription factor RcaD [Cyanobacteria bacterium UBA8543]